MLSNANGISSSPGSSGRRRGVKWILYTMAGTKLANGQVVKHPGSNGLQKPLIRVCPLLEGEETSCRRPGTEHSVKLDVTRNPLNF